MNYLAYANKYKYPAVVFCLWFWIDFWYPTKRLFLFMDEWLADVTAVLPELLVCVFTTDSVVNLTIFVLSVIAFFLFVQILAAIRNYFAR